MSGTSHQGHQARVGQRDAAFFRFTTTRHDAITNSPVRELGMVPIIRTL
jgi:hypothetical protein